LTAVVSCLFNSSPSATRQSPLSAMALTKLENLCPSSTSRRNIVVRHRSRDRVPLAPPGREAMGTNDSRVGKRPIRGRIQRSSQPRRHRRLNTTHSYYVKTVGPLPATIATAMSHVANQISSRAKSRKSAVSARPAAVVIHTSRLWNVLRQTGIMRVNLFTAVRSAIIVFASYCLSYLLSSPKIRKRFRCRRETAQQAILFTDVLMHKSHQ